MSTAPSSLRSVRPQADTLTYEPFFGLTEKPFALDSDPRFLYHSPSHAATFDGLLASIRRREGLVVLTGEIGTGKTTLCRAVLRSLGRKTFSAFVPDPFASREDLLKMILIDFGVITIHDLTTGPLKQASRAELSYLLSGFLASLDPLDAFVVVIIDEAQNMLLPMIEETRILADAFGGTGRLQIVFVGQLELLSKLKQPELRQVDQRVCSYNRLSPLGLDAVAGYLQHRVHMAGGRAGQTLFSPDVIELLHRRSGGVPRLINRICDRALHLAHQREAAFVDRDTLETALVDVGPTTLTPTWASIMFPEPEVAEPASLAHVTPVQAVDAPWAAAAAPVAEAVPAATAVATPALAVPAAPPPTAPRDTAPPDTHGESEDFTKRVDEWLTQELAPTSRKLTHLRTFAREAPQPPSQRSPAARKRGAGRKIPSLSSASGRPGDGRSRTPPPRRARVWAKGIAIAMVSVAALIAAAPAASHLPQTLTGLVMAAAELPAVPAPPALAVPDLPPLPAPPIEPRQPPIASVRPAVSGDYLVVVGLFASPERAERLVLELTQAGLPALHRPFHLRTQVVQQVILGPFGNRTDANVSLQRLRRLGEYDDANVVDSVPTPAAP